MILTGLIISVLLEMSFVFVYFSGLLVSFPKPLGDIYWVGAGASGIVFGLLYFFKGQTLLSKLMSMVVIISGAGLIGLLILALFIISM